jgi:DNA repair photolyase
MLLEKHPVYLCISYDTDLLAAEGLTGYAREWADFAASHPDLTIEIRTKSAHRQIWDNLPALPGLIYAFTISPQPVIERFEHGTPDLENRLESAAAAMRCEHPVRLCFDPILYLPDWQTHYQEMAGMVSDCDIVVNPIVKGSVASIINKVGDYALSGVPVINTQESEEYRKLVETYHCGINCRCGNSDDVADAIERLLSNPALRKSMSEGQKRLGKEKFDRRYTYSEIVNGVERLFYH